MKLLVLALIAVLVPVNLAQLVTIPPMFEQTTQAPKNFTYMILMNQYSVQQRFLEMCVMIQDSISHVNISVYNSGRLISRGHIEYDNMAILHIPSKKIRGRKSITVEASTMSGPLFKTSTMLYRRHRRTPVEKPFEIFLQQDKPFYKPTDKVRFRCFGVNNELKVIKQPMNVKIYDPHHNLMHIWNDQQNHSGVVSHEFQLSDQPVLGKWKIEVNQGSYRAVNTEKYFFVQKYVLPNMKVTVDADRYICHLGYPAFYLAKRYIDIVINARYSFGGPVKGRAILKITITGRQKISYKKVFRINGRIKYRFYLKDFFELEKEAIVYMYAGMPSYINLRIVAKVIEDETDLDMSSAPSFVSVIKAPIEIQSPYQIFYKPGLSTEVKLQIKRVDNKPLTWEDIKNHLNISFIRGKEVLSTLVRIPLDGKIVFHLPLESYDRIRLYYTGYYQDCKYILVRDIYLRKFSSLVPYYMKVSLKKSTCFAGDAIGVIIKSTTTLKKCYYLILKNNRFVGSGHVSVYGPSTTVLINSSTKWIPFIKILFTCFTSNNNILVDVLPLKLCSEFKYQIGGMYLHRNRSAGQRTFLNMGSADGSTLYIMAVDERVEFMKKPDYITKDKIMESFNKDLGRVFHNARSVPNLLHLCDLTWMSNKKFPYYWRRRYHFRNMATSMPQRPMPEFLKRSAVKVRDEFPEVWLWMEKYVNSNGYVHIPLITPDTITNWKTYAFAVHPTLGLSILPKPIEFLSFQRMFLILNLPYSVIRYEQLFVNIVIFNYLPKRKRVRVDIKNSKFSCKDRPWREIMVPAKSYKSVKFSIQPSLLGDIPIRIDLKEWKRGKFRLVDRLQKYLKVKPEGRTLYFSKEYVADMTGSGMSRFHMRIKIPPRYLVRDSERIEVSVTGDYMGPVIDDLGKYVRLPTGCGEQTALYFVPNTYIYSYLKIRKALKKRLEMKLIKFTRFGYQNQLRFQRWDGSYSAFQRDRQGSVWLTAFIIKSFQEVINSGMPVYIYKSKLRSSLRWLLKRQYFNGKFKETGRVIHKRMQGGSAGEKSLTAYVVMTLESMRSLEPYAVSRALKKAKFYLNTLNLKQLDVYTLCILLCTYAKLNNTRSFKSVEAVLLPQATEDRYMLYWKGDYSIEQTAYVLYAYSIKKDFRRGKKILTWLLSKRNSLGGFSNTQDTVISLEAMTDFSSLMNHTSNTIVTIRALNQMHVFKPINPTNIYLVQKKTVPRNTRVIYVTATGNNFVYIKASWQFNVYKEKQKDFGLLVKVKTTLNKRLTLDICYKWTKNGSTDMLVSMVQLPSGFKMQSVKCKEKFCEKYNNCTRSNCLSAIDTKDDEVHFYLNELFYNRPIWISTVLRRIHVVDNKDTDLYIRTKSYYDGKENVVAYNPFMNTLPEMSPW